MTSIRLMCVLGLLSFVVGCATPKGEAVAEGTNPGDCADGADNDEDGLFDCDDPGCFGSALCDDFDSDADADSDSDADADADSDSDSDADADSDSDSDADGDPVDDDGDGSVEGVDCDDQDDTVYPGAEEVCDDKDNDCDGDIDNDPVDGTAYYDDQDSDGYGDPDFSQLSCSPPHGYVTNDQDCDDFDHTVHPGASESCDSIDEDCDGDIDEGLETTTFYADEDGDGFGDPSSSVDSCSEPAGTVEDFSDCDDDDSRAHPGAREIAWNGVDEDCDGYDLDFEDCADDTVGNSLDFVTGYTYTVSDMSGDITVGIFDFGDWSITEQVLWLRNEEHSVSTTAEVDEIDVSIDLDIYMTANLYADDAITGISNCDIEVGPVPVNYSGIMEINPRAAFATSEIELDMLLLADPSSSTRFGGCDLALLDMIVGFTDLPLDFTGMVDSTVELVAGEVGELLEDDIEFETELTCRD